MTDARRAGRIDWDHIIDGTRTMTENQHWNSPSEILRVAAKTYRRNLRRTQEYRIEVWIEKSALAGILEATCQELDVPLLPVRGFSSATILWDARNRIIKNFKNGQPTLIIYGGDHDPSGMAIPETIQKQFKGLENMFILERFGLNLDQVHEHNLPPNFAKEKDTRYPAYKKQYGPLCWELDALLPSVLISQVKKTVDEFTDYDKMRLEYKRQEEERQELKRKVA